MQDSSKVLIGTLVMPACAVTKNKMISPPRKRHGIVSGIIIPPYFCQPPAALGCDKSVCVGPVLSVPDSSAPSPPESSGSGLSHELTPILGQRKLVLFVFGSVVRDEPARITTSIATLDSACAKRAHPSKAGNSVQRRICRAQHRAGLVAGAVLDVNHRGIDAFAEDIFQRYAPAA